MSSLEHDSYSYSSEALRIVSHGALEALEGECEEKQGAATIAISDPLYKICRGPSRPPTPDIMTS